MREHKYKTCGTWHDRQRPLWWALILGIVAGAIGSFGIIVRELIVVGGLPTDWMLGLVMCFAGALALAFLVGVAIEMSYKYNQKQLDRLWRSQQMRWVKKLIAISIIITFVCCVAYGLVLTTIDEEDDEVVESLIYVKSMGGHKNVIVGWLSPIWSVHVSFWVIEAGTGVRCYSEIPTNDCFVNINTTQLYHASGIKIKITDEESDLSMKYLPCPSGVYVAMLPDNATLSAVVINGTNVLLYSNKTIIGTWTDEHVEKSEYLIRDQWIPD